jgi:hypothetical protein
VTDRLESRLAGLADHIDWPTRDLRTSVETRLADDGARRRPSIGWVAAAATAIALVVVILSPAGRTAVADLLGVVGIEIRWSDELSVRMEGELDLGQRVTVAEAVGGTDFALLLPAALDHPDAIFLESGRVATVWVASPDLPEAGDSGVGLLHLQFRAELDSALVSKRLGPDTSVQSVSVRGRTGFWIEGAPHVVTYLENGVEREETTRLAGNVLLWEQDGVTNRIESDLPLVDVLTIVASLQPVSGT